MGSLVAYDALKSIERRANLADIRVAHWITLGSPLGLAALKGLTLGRHGACRTPACVRKSWMNFSDPRDWVCLDTRLGDEYAANGSGVQARDASVWNDYPGNPHKSYGYLRTPEFSEHLASLLRG